MKINFRPTTLTEITSALTDHITRLPGATDTFFEEHIEAASHYHIVIDGTVAGYTSIHGGSMITQFCLFDRFKSYGQSVFQRVKKLEHVQRAFVPTCDEFFLTHALDEHRRLEMQAYFFLAGPEMCHEMPADTFSFRPANLDDATLIRQESDTFFDPVEERIKRGELFITYRDGVCAGFGLMVRCKFRRGGADLGIYTKEAFRNMGVATATIQFLLGVCRQHEFQAVAGCWYYNHFSKQALEKGGMYSPSRLFKISY